MRKFALIATPAAAAALAVGGLLASISWYARPAGDDYCTATDVRRLGPLGVGWDWFAHVNGRTVNGVVSALLLTSPVSGANVVPWLWLIGLPTLLVVAARRLLPALPGLPLAAAAALITVAAFLSTATPYDSLFWLSAAVSHVLPMMMSIAAIALLAARPTWLPVLALLGVAIGQTNEAIGVLLAVTVVQAGLVLWRRGVPIMGALALAGGAVAGSALTVLSPGSFSRREDVATVMPPLDLCTLFVGPVKQSGVVLADLLAQPAAAAVLLAGVCLGLTCGRPLVVLRPLTIAAPAVLALQWTLGVLVALTIGYRSPAAAPRAYIAITLAVLLAVCWYGALLGQWLRPHAGSVTVAGLATSVLAAGALAVGVPQVLDLRQAARGRAVAWDAQNAQLSALPANVRSATIRRLPIGNTPQPSYETGLWLLRCMRSYHHLDGLKVTS